MESQSGLDAAVSVIRLMVPASGSPHRQNLPTGPLETEQVIAQLVEERFEEKDEEELRYMPRHELRKKLEEEVDED